MSAEALELDDLLLIEKYVLEASALGTEHRVKTYKDVHLLIDDYRAPLFEIKLKEKINNSLAIDFIAQKILRRMQYEWMGNERLGTTRKKG